MNRQAKAATVASSNSLQSIAGKVPYLIDGTVTGKAFKQIVVQTDGTTISVLTGNLGTNYLTLCNLSGKSLYKGAIIASANNEPIENITVTAGQALGYE